MFEEVIKDFHIYPRTPHPDRNHQCYCGTTGIGSGHEQTRGALSHHSEGGGRWPAKGRVALAGWGCWFVGEVVIGGFILCGSQEKCIAD